MTFEIIFGTTRDYHVDRAGCCSKCGFMEQNLVCWDDGREIHVECEECVHQTAPDGFPELMAVFLPELPPKAFSNYVRVLAWLTFAARVDRLDGHDFRTGNLPLRFIRGNGWSAPIRWRSITEGLADRYAGDVAKAGLRQAREAFAFVSSRIKRTEAEFGSASVAAVRAAVGDLAFERDYRPMSVGVPTDRIRSWGNPGSTFQLLAARSEQYR
jgi:hypothetical protein